MRAKDRATTADTPASFNARGACSREEPLPKLRPATIMSPFWTFSAKCGSRPSMTCCAQTWVVFCAEVLARDDHIRVHVVAENPSLAFDHDMEHILHLHLHFVIIILLHYITFALHAHPFSSPSTHYSYLLYGRTIYGAILLQAIVSYTYFYKFIK